MKCLISNFAGRKTEIELSSVLEPQTYVHDGVAERALGQAQANAEAIGRLLAFMVERQRMSLQDAKRISGVYQEIELLS